MASLDLPGLTDVQQEEECHHSNAGLYSYSVSSPVVTTTANLTPGDTAPGLVPARDLSDVHPLVLSDIPALGLPDEPAIGLPVVPVPGLPQVTGADQLPISAVLTSHSRSTHSLMCPDIATPTCSEQDCSNSAFSTPITSPIWSHAGGGCAGGVAGWLLECKTRSEDHHSSTSGVAWDNNTHHKVGHTTDPHSDSAGGTDIGIVEI